MTVTPQAAALPAPTYGIPEPASYGDPQRNGLTANDLFEAITEHLFFSLGRRASGASIHDLYLALSLAVRDRLVTRQLASDAALKQAPARWWLSLRRVPDRSPAGQQPADAGDP